MQLAQAAYACMRIQEEGGEGNIDDHLIDKRALLLLPRCLYLVIIIIGLSSSFVCVYKYIYVYVYTTYYMYVRPFVSRRGTL
mmetsp:Transcript_33366/g.62043  ORF Transcript_33366/g.62043 Transcript_33366/m.62043 type:complete len:82 (+) Transcript_33366:37-282(+)